MDGCREDIGTCGDAKEDALAKEDLNIIYRNIEYVNEYPEAVVTI